MRQLSRTSPNKATRTFHKNSRRKFAKTSRTFASVRILPQAFEKTCPLLLPTHSQKLAQQLSQQSSFRKGVHKHTQRLSPQLPRQVFTEPKKVTRYALQANETTMTTNLTHTAIQYSASFQTDHRNGKHNTQQAQRTTTRNINYKPTFATTKGA